MSPSRLVHSSKPAAAGLLLWAHAGEDRRTDRQIDQRTPHCYLDRHLHAIRAVPIKKVKGSPYSITERRAPELISVLGSQPAGDVSHKPGGRLPLLSSRLAVTPATLKRAATNFAAW